MVSDSKGKGLRVKLPEKEYLSFVELAEKWRCQPSDLFHLIATAKIIPSLFLDGKFPVLMAKPWTEDTDELHISPLHISGNGEAMQSEYVDGIYYLPMGRRDINNSSRLNFPYAFESREIEECGIGYSPGESIEIEYQPMSGQVHTSHNVIFVREEIERFERDHTLPATPYGVVREPTEKPLGARERNTLLRIIHALAKSDGLDLSHPHKAAESIKATLDILECGMSIDTIAAKLKEAREILNR
jgi:hypothetical protein